MKSSPIARKPKKKRNLRWKTLLKPKNWKRKNWKPGKRLKRRRKRTKSSSRRKRKRQKALNLKTKKGTCRRSPKAKAKPKGTKKLRLRPLLPKLRRNQNRAA